jgi:hypothetical protein
MGAGTDVVAIDDITVGIYCFIHACQPGKRHHFARRADDEEVG